MEWTSEQLSFRDRIRDYLERELVPLTPQIDRDGYYPMDVVKNMAPLGLLGMVIPERYGGSELSASTRILAIEELARICGSTCLSIAAHTALCCAPIEAFGTEAQKQRYLTALASGQMLGGFAITEPGAGSDVQGMKTNAERRGDHYVLNGSKLYITNGGLAGVYVVGANTMVDGENLGISTFLVEPDWNGFSIGKAEDKMGLRGSHTTELSFDNVEIPAENLLGVEYKGFGQLMQILEGGRIGIGAMAVGLSQAALDTSIAYVHKNTSMARQQAIQWRLADMATEIEAARLLVQKVAWLKDQGRDYRKTASMAKLFASEASNRVTASALEIFGAMGSVAPSPVERYIRDARLTEIGEGTSEVQRLIIAKTLMKEADQMDVLPGDRLLEVAADVETEDVLEMA